MAENNIDLPQAPEISKEKWEEARKSGALVLLGIKLGFETKN